MDALLQFVLEEVAMDGDAGTSVESLSRFIAEFYSRSTSGAAGNSNALVSRAQLVDDSFVSFVWNSLLAEPDVRVGVLSPLAVAEGPKLENANAPQVAPATVATPPPPDNVEDTKPSLAASKKAGKRKIERKPQGPTHQMRILGGDERALGRDALHAKYRDALRILTSEETARLAITGSPHRIPSITPIIYTILQMASRGRENGTTAVRISKELGIDPRSVFHYIKILQQVGVVRKFTDVDQSCRTNRILHVRYLDRSEAWRTHIRDEPEANKDEGQEGEGAMDAGETGAGGGHGAEWSGLEMPPISPAYLDSNIPLIRARIIKAIKRRQDAWIPHIELHGSIGLHAMNSASLRRLNAIVTQLANEGVLEKISVTRKKAGNKTLTASALRLCTKREEDDVDPETTALARDGDPATQRRRRVGQEDTEEDEAFLKVGIPIERQILNLLTDADARGLTLAEISAALHGFAPRFIEAILQRMARTPPPAHLGDYSLHSMQETVGRLKQARWFSLVGYLAFRRARGFPDDAAEETWAALTGSSTELVDSTSRLGAFETPEGSAPAEGQYSSLSEHQRRIDSYNIWAGPSAPAIPNEGSIGEAPRPKKLGRPPKAGNKGKAKAVDQDEVAAGPQDESAASSPASARNAAPVPVGSRVLGRPRKYALAPGEESTYMRRKREKEEDEERERQGLPPLERPKPTRRKKAVKTDEGETDKNDTEGASGTPAPNRQKRGKKKKEGKDRSEPGATAIDPGPQAGPSTSPSNATVEPSNDASLTVVTDADEVTSSAAPLIPKRKRGRPRKIPILAVPEVVDELRDAAHDGSTLDVSQDSQRSEAGVATPTPDAGSTAAAASGHTAPVELTMENGSPPTMAAPLPGRIEQDSGSTVARRTRSSACTATTPAPAASERKRAHQPTSPSTGTPTRSAPLVELEVTPSRARKRARTGIEAFDALRGLVSSSPPPPPEAPRAGLVSEIATEPSVAGNAERASQHNESEGLNRGDATSPEPVRVVGALGTIQADAADVVPSSSSPVSRLRPSLAHPIVLSQDSISPRFPSVTDSSPNARDSKPTPLSRRRRPRTSAVAQGNLTMLERLRDIVDYITAHGGFTEFNYALNENMARFLKKRRPDVPLMDRTVLRQALEACVERELLRKTSAVSGRAQRIDVYYLPSVKPDAPELVNHLRALAAASRPYTRGPHIEHLVLDEAFDVEEVAKEDKAAPVLNDPVPTDSPDTVRHFFSQQPLVVGRKYGVRQGRAARARQMHKWLASWIFRHAGEPDLVASQDDEGYIVAQKTLLNQMPVGVFVRLVPLPFESEALDKFLEDPLNCQMSMVAAPSEIVEIIRPHQPKRKAAMWSNFESLQYLRLLAPLIPHHAEPGRFEPSPRPKLATHWRFATTAPLYALGGNRSLIDVCELNSNQAVGEYWHRLQAVSSNSARSEPGKPIESTRFPSTCAWIGRHIVRRDFGRDASWRDTYQLVELQRNFLFRLVQHDEGLATNVEQRADDLEKWARALFAPTEVVKAYLITAHQKFLDNKVAIQMTGKPRGGRRKRAKVMPPAGNGEVDQDDAEAAARRASAATALHRKIQDAAGQRERDWTGILERFRAEHSQPDLHAGTVDWLHRAFLDPRRQLDAKHLDAELRRLLPTATSATAGSSADPAFKSIVPISLQKKARAAQNPYAIENNMASLTKRVRKVRPKERAPNQADAPPSAQRAIAASRTEADVQVHAPVTVASGTQDDFLTVPVPARPPLERGRRLTRNFYTTEQDDLILDAYAVLRARAQMLGARINYQILAEFFSGSRSTAIRQRALAVLRKPGMQDYHDRLVGAYLDEYRATGVSTIPDPLPKSMVTFDLAACIRFLRAKVSKPQVRLMRAVPQPAVMAAQIVPLPAKLEQLQAQYKIVPLKSSAGFANRFDKIWNKYHIATNLREESVVNIPFSETFQSTEPEPPIAWEQELVRGACKAIVATDQHRYDSAMGDALLAPLDNGSVVEDVIKDLEVKQVMQKPKEERRGPGTGLRYNDRYLSRFESTTSVSRLREAANFDKELYESGGTTFPLVPTEGDMLALFDLLSAGHIDLSIDTSVLSAKALDPSDFGTRQANDDDIECAVTIVPVKSFEKAIVPLPEALLPAGITADEAALVAAHTSLPADDALARAIELRIATAGAEGSQLASLSYLARDQGYSSADLAQAVELLTSSTPPLAFFAGTHSLKLVHARHLAKWALPLPVSVEGAANEEEKRWFLPTLWTGVDGKVNVDLWTRACSWVKGELWTRSGSTCPSIVDRAVQRQILAAHEVQTILRTLHSADSVTRIEGGGLDKGDDDAEINWEKDHWALRGCVWH